ncbi:MAG: CaiB/BaiF CoA transferase family protein [Dehalococcoidia bacterium]
MGESIPPPACPPPPLDGVKVLDLSWVMVGPVSARVLADLGADVIKVESAKRIDPLRTLGPFKDGQSGPERSLSWHNLNAGKRSLTLNLKHPGAIEVVHRLAGWADVVLESFTPRALRGMGLTYADLSAVNPHLIMLSTSLYGQTGPWAENTIGVGTMGAASSGATYLIGWPDRLPTGPFGPWTDAVTPRFAVATILAALHHRSRTGAGTYIDLSQSEAGLQFLTPALLEFAVNGSAPERRGSRSPLRVPHGTYPCRGDDHWIAIDASADGSWRALAGLVGPALADRRFATLIGRLRHRDEVDAMIAAWTRDQEGNAMERLLQSHGIAAHVASRATDLADDPHVAATGHLRPIEDPVIGQAAIEGSRFRLTRTPAVPTRRGPLIGEHTSEILTALVGYSEEEVAALAMSGALE